jgi:hypothetical protein
MREEKQPRCPTARTGQVCSILPPLGVFCSHTEEGGGVGKMPRPWASHCLCAKDKREGEKGFMGTREVLGIENEKSTEMEEGTSSPHYDFCRAWGRGQDWL